MRYLPVVIKPYPNELIYSWICRLINANGLSEGNFLEAYLGYRTAKIDSLPYDVRRELVSLNEHLFLQEDIMQLLLEHSTYPFEAAFMTQAQQTRYINNITRPKSKLNPSVNGLFRNVYVCPDCMAEDEMLFGESYLHREHHLSGVSVCPKHGRPLLEYRGRKGHACEYDLYDWEEVACAANLSLLLEYAVYARAILDIRASVDINDLKELISEKTEDKLGFVSDYQTCKYAALFRSDAQHFMTSKYYSLEHISPEEMLPILMFLYPERAELLQRIKEMSHRDILEYYTCPECGYGYYATSWGHLTGWKCPVCDRKKDEHELAAELINAQEDGHYQLISPFESLNQRAEILHKDCQTVCHIMPRSFLFENTRCICESRILAVQAEKQVEKNEGFRLIEFNGTNRPIRIFHEDCGKSFVCNYHKFLLRPHCHACAPSRMSTEAYKQRIFGLVGDEYTLMSPFVDQHTKIEIRHNTCGKSAWYQPNHFLEGQRCPSCSKVTGVWNEKYLLLVKYKKEFGHTSIAKRESYYEKSLGYWCQAQRDKYSKGILLEKQLELLNKIGFDFTPHESEWMRRYEQYKRYIKTTGSCSITRRADFENEHLGAWVETQKKNYKTGKLSAERTELLGKINDYFRL